MIKLSNNIANNFANKKNQVCIRHILATLIYLDTLCNLVIAMLITRLQTLGIVQCCLQPTLFHGLFSGVKLSGGKGRRAAESLRLSVYLNFEMASEVMK